MGGGSSDAASCLLALDRLWNLRLPLPELERIGLQLGADVPFFLRGHNAWVEGTIMANKRYTSPTAEDRTALLDWLKARAEVGEANASDLHDAWHHDGEV